MNKMRVQAKNKNINGKLFINNKLKIQPMEDKEANSNTFKKYTNSYFKLHNKLVMILKV